MTFKFDLEAGFAIRKQVRLQLQNSKKTLEFEYPGCSVLVIEDKEMLESTFHVRGKNLPDSAEQVIKQWGKQIQQWV